MKSPKYSNIHKLYLWLELATDLCLSWPKVLKGVLARFEHEQAYRPIYFNILAWPKPELQDITVCNAENKETF